MTQEELVLNVGLRLEHYLISWDDILWEWVPLRVRKYKRLAERGEMLGVGHHPEFGWFVLAGGQGPLCVWCETPREELFKRWQEILPSGRDVLTGHRTKGAK